MYTHQECEYIGNIQEYTTTLPPPQKCVRVTEESATCDNGGSIDNYVTDGGDFDNDERNEKTNQI